jgi:S-DNA-T family DNA segregation ATPase FtsK/SpoIIIE
MLLPNEQMHFEEQEKEVRRKAKVLEKTFASFGFNVKVVEIETGPVIAQFELELETGLRLAKITSLADDVAIALRVPSVRIVAPIPGKNTVGIEVPNETRQLVRLREVIEEGAGKAAKMKIPIYLGKDVAGNPMIADLASLPHLLIAGRTGTGKSVCLNTILMSLMMTRRPDEVRMLLIDPKMVELSPYKTLPHLMHPVVTDMKKAEALLAWAVEKMEERYALLARAGVRHIAGYNQLGEEELMERLQPETDDERKAIPTHLPYIVIVADEMADLMMTSAKEVETHIIRLAQKSRAVGIHLVLATQKPTVDVITGLIKSNLPARIAFQVASRTDSRVVLDEMGADKLLGNGDMLFLWPGTSTLIRGQGTYVSDEEINRVVEFVGTSEPDFVQELVQLKPADAGEQGPDRFKKRDELYEAAIDVIVREGRGSVSLLQRALGVGYGRGARLIDFMAEDGIVGPYNGSQAREVLVTVEQWAAMSGQSAEAVAPIAAPTPSRHSNRIQMTHEDDVEEEEEEIDDEESDVEDGDDDSDVEEVEDDEEVWSP